MAPTATRRAPSSAASKGPRPPGRAHNRTRAAAGDTAVLPRPSCASDRTGDVRPVLAALYRRVCSLAPRTVHSRIAERSAVRGAARDELARDHVGQRSPVLNRTLASDAAGALASRSSSSYPAARVDPRRVPARRRWTSHRTPHARDPVHPESKPSPAVSTLSKSRRTPPHDHLALSHLTRAILSESRRRPRSPARLATLSLMTSGCSTGARLSDRCGPSARRFATPAEPQLAPRPDRPASSSWPPLSRSPQPRRHVQRRARALRLRSNLLRQRSRTRRPSLPRHLAPTSSPARFSTHPVIPRHRRQC